MEQLIFFLSNLLTPDSFSQDRRLYVGDSLKLLNVWDKKYWLVYEADY